MTIVGHDIGVDGERAARNEAIFREVNERIERLERQLGGDDDLQLVCECSNERCTERIVVGRSEYERVRAVPTQFIVVPQHVDRSVEEVVDRRDGFAVVAKRPGPAGDTAIETDPRS